MGGTLLAALAHSGIAAEQAPSASPASQARQLGGSHASIEVRRRQFIDNWVSRFNEVTGQKVEPGPF